MKKTVKISLIVLLIVIAAFIVTYNFDPFSSRSARVVDMSSITLPSYPLPAGYITKQEAINIALKAAEAHLHKGEVPKNIQCLLLPYGIGHKILYGTPEITKERFRLLENGRLSREKLKNYMKKYYAYNSRLMYFIIMDVNRYPGEALIRFPPRAAGHVRLINGKYITTQDTYVIDAKTGNIVGHGYYGSVKHIYPKQN